MNMKTDELDFSLIPKHMRSGVENYLNKGWQPGGFLTSMLSSDISVAARHADPVNKASITKWVEFMLTQLPEECWGTPEKVEAWINKGGFGLDD